MYELIISDLSFEDGKRLYARMTRNHVQELHGTEGMSWGPSAARQPGLPPSATIDLRFCKDQPREKAVPFLLLRNIENASEIRNFGGYIEDGRCLVVDHYGGEVDEALCSDWEPIDGHGTTIDWPEA